ncbi:MAG: PD40 domain-containing protein [Acidobacteria bacterium]|nr:PD40 domain-containing protein [Acidobacteriota bacterium]
MNLEDGKITVLTTEYDNFPVWSPKGDLIAFTSFRDADFEVYTIHPDGNGLRRLTRTPGNDGHCSWSPDGQWLLFSSAWMGFKDEGPLFDGIPQPYGELFVMRAEQLTDNQWEDATPAWQPERARMETSRR